MTRARFALLTLWAANAVWAQTSAIQGVITDASGAMIPRAAVQVTNLETGVSNTATSNEVGFYSVPLLAEGRYKVECRADGFAPQVRPEMRLEVGQTARVDCRLSVGVVAEQVEVSASATLIESETTSVGQVIDRKRIVEMPLNGRNYLELAQFSVGVLPASQLNKGQRTGGEGGFFASGIQPLQNNVQLDGADNSSRALGGALSFEAQAVKPPVDAVSEFKVITNNTSAEYGWRAGAKVIVSTRSGTNEFHGSAYEFLRNDRLDGANFFANRAGSAKPSYRQNQFGGTFGGPVIKNRTFFFTSFQGTRVRLGRSYTSSVPSREVLNGDFSSQPSTRRNIFDPLTLTGTGANARRLPFAGNRIPASRWDPVAKRVADFFPAPNIPGREHQPNNFFYAPKDTERTDQYDFRGDHHINDFHRIFVRYSVRNQDELQPGPMPLPADGAAGQTLDLDADNVVLNYNATLGTTMYNEMRFGWTHFPANFNHVFTENINKQVGIKGAPGDSFGDGLDQGYARFAFTGFNQLGPRQNWPNFGDFDNLTVANSTIWQRGRHSLKFGGEYRRLNQSRSANGFRRGFLQMTGQYTAELPNNATSRANTGNAMADMLLGWASTMTYGNGRGENIVAPYHGFFLQDDVKLTSRLTLNVGLRWELFVTPYFPRPEIQTAGRWLTEINGVRRDEERIIFPTDGRDCGCREDFNNFAPRLGLAYRLAGNTVIRAGAGLYYGEPNFLGEEAPRFFTGPPKYVELALTQPRETTGAFVQQGFPPFQVTGQLLPEVTVTTSFDFQPNLYAGQWFFDIQQNLPGSALLTVGYNGSKSTHLHREGNINTPPTPHSTLRWQDRRLRPQFNSVEIHENSLNSHYHSLTAKIEKRFTRGLTFLSSFTWAHNIDFRAERQAGESSGVATQHNYSLERGSSDLDRRLAYSLSLVYELPLGKNWFLKGWQVGGIFSLLSGTPYDHSINVDNQNLGGGVRGNYVRNPNLPRSERTIDRWFDAGFVVPSAPGVISNAGRNLILGPDRRNFDFILSKNFALPREGHEVQFRFESFNFTNTPHFGSPNTAVGTPAVGRITAAEDPRRIQFALKYLF
jgi:hypothetical protein